MLTVAMLAVVAFGEASAAAADAVFGYEAWRRAVEKKGLDPDEVVYPFHASAEMIDWAEDAIRATRGLDPYDRLTSLQEAMFAGAKLDFDYDDERTLTAARAFAARRGNCMSFTALFVALSRSVGIPTVLMEVRRDPTVARDDDGLVVISRHVVAAYRSGGGVWAFDFYVSSTAPFAGGSVIDDVRASAMYHANLGGAALRENDLDTALKNLETTTMLAPDWSAGWVNLGVTYAHMGRFDEAFKAYRRALEIDPVNASALNNMSILYENLGREAEARIALRAAAEQTESPFTLLAMADSEMLYGNNREAAKYLKRARRWYPKEPAVYEALARLAGRTGEVRREEKYLRKARQLRSANPDNR